MKYLGIDFGSKRIGIAISNTEGTIAFPRTTIESDDAALAVLKDVCVNEKIEVLVVGDTRSLSGGANPVTEVAEAFAAKLAAATGLTVRWVREAGSSVAVSETSRESHDDAAAAAFILQRYLDGVH